VSLIVDDELWSAAERVARTGALSHEAAYDLLVTYRLTESDALKIVDLAATSGRSFYEVAEAAKAVLRSPR